ncbi:phospholipase A [Ketobacter sp.]|uniref:phospholipase A n=1 Tax=Ketobacter sp. TaxID=2083498 RepID=UPI000F17BCF3|nr:phospholipase A [Ketobacter sp.]RLT93970.1 MAG: phospholipase [Ketobacter sp.]
MGGFRTAYALDLEDCVADAIQNNAESRSIGDIRTHCEQQLESASTSVDGYYRECLGIRGVNADPSVSAASIVEQCKADQASGHHLPQRYSTDRRTETNPYIISPLRQNYILPYTYLKDPNQEPYELVGDELVENEEAKLQISIKVPLSYTDLFTANDGIYFGFTLKSFWQVYSGDISAPFRETNYRPEIFYQAPLPIDSVGTWVGRVGLEHESNGRSQLLSRSWNRAYVSLGYNADNWALMLQPWYRFPEDDKEDDGDPNTPLPPDGDDNPDIEDYMGHFELTGAYRWDKVEFSGLFRRNFAEGNGAVEVGVSFPLWGRLRGYAQYFDGYGESMIDYNHKNQRIGIGVLLTDLL